MSKVKTNSDQILSSFDYLCRKDKIFKQIIKLYGYPPQWKRSEGFETLCQIIIEQQVSLESAKSCYLKLKKYIGDFTAKKIDQCNMEELRDCSLSRQKASYLKALALAIVSGDLDLNALKTKDAEEIRKELIKVKGIGNWTVDVYLIFCLQSPNVFPLGDIAVFNTIKELWGFETKEVMLSHSKKWEPHLTSATFLLWHYYLSKRGRTIVY